MCCWEEARAEEHTYGTLELVMSVVHASVHRSEVSLAMESL